MSNSKEKADSQVILLVEDSPEDYAIALRALSQSGIRNPLYRCEDGEDALDYLYQRGAYSEPSSAPRPGLILLDLNMPGTDGRDVLAELKADSLLRSIPVIILTTSSDSRDIEECYELGANSYIVKPVSLEGFVNAFKQLKDYWFEIVILPKSKS